MENCHETSCPFAYTDESEKIQNYGCLPTPKDILQMRILHNKTWACHSNPKIPCKGAITTLKERKLEYKVIDKELLTEESQWHLCIK